MTTEEFPKQPDFKIVSESYGQALLADNSVIETRIILADLVMLSDDPLMGPALAINPIVALRIKSPPEVRQIVRNKPHIEKTNVAVPPTLLAGFEPMDVLKTINPTVSTYIFDQYLLTLTLEVSFAARNINYKSDTDSPVYNIRWSINSKLTKATA